MPIPSRNSEDEVGAAVIEYEDIAPNVDRFRASLVAFACLVERHFSVVIK